MTQEISVQLYAVREELDADLDGTLGKLADIGLRNVEGFNFVPRAAELRAGFARYGLSVPTAHGPFLSTELKFGDQVIPVPPPEKTFEAAAELGTDTVIDPYVAPDRWQSVDDIHRTADALNKAADVAAGFGLRVGYHNHAHELEFSSGGKFGFEIFADRLDPRVVLEVDTYWSTVGGANTPELLRSLGSRVAALHIKDGPLGDDPFDQTPAGQGAVDIAAILAAAPANAYAVIEFDQYAGDIFEGIKESYRYLSQKGLK
ncbi:sugar phosphate isomerase/epimerase [Lysinibacter sp. HNR]|uniref:sugar phosphate isomerase/epimerase family protein n=1 Tax=Lysinibacter sp. HNR TaxID=3031408 RepID=UPI0024358599|nr:sugar phosphate isomerase/epimerase [Lysinibacter sp. HNR]WGD37289.1 sugar phosphate isomerase/epimerase [Lysinibacter sp. HNR]